MTCSIIKMLMPRSHRRADDRHNVADFRWVEARQHLVEQQQIRLGRERTRELQALAAGDGQRIGRPIEASCARPTSRPTLFRNAKRRPARTGWRKKAPDQDILAHREPGEGLHDLKSPRDAAPRQAMRRLAGYVLAAVADACRRLA